MSARRLTMIAAYVAALAASTSPALAAFPYARPGADTTDFSDLYLNAGQTPDDLSGDDNEWKYAATSDPANVTVNANPVELGGVRGAHIVDDDARKPTAWQVTTGRPDVTIAVLDSGIKWNEQGAMQDLRFKTRLNAGELPAPQGAGGSACADDDCNGDGIFNLADYLDDPRVTDVVANDPRRVGPAGLMTPQDVIIAFSDGVDDDANGFVDDIAGWDFLDDDNDAFDDVQYGHGTGEAEGSTAEADNGVGQSGSCPNCMSVPLRVGDSFIADVNRFAAAVIYATDNDVQVVQEALGSLNNSSLAEEAVDYAYRHGVTVIASAADEAAQHNNWPSSLPHVILVNSVRDEGLAAPANSYLAFNGCTNFNAKITLAIPSVSCSSDATGVGSGMAGLIYSAALSARDGGALGPYPDSAACEQTNGDPCVITPNEVRQVMASGTIDGVLQSDDVDFAGTPPGSASEPSCTATPTPDCTSPYGPGGALKAQVDANRPSHLGPEAATTSYPARRGHDQFYGWGRSNMNRATRAIVDDPAAPSDSRLPPEAEITSPEWFQQVDPDRAGLAVRGEVFARGAPYSCELLVAPGQYPNQARTTDTPPGDFEPLEGGWCDGATVHDGAAAAGMHSGRLGRVDLADLKSLFPPGTDFGGPEPPASAATANGRPAFAPHSFTLKLVASTEQGTSMTGEDQRAAYLHRDQDMLDGFPRTIRRGGLIRGAGAPTADGESSPVLADLDGDNRAELVFGTSDGFVHAIRRDGSELRGWPVRTDRQGFVSGHLGTRAFQSGEVHADLGGSVLASVAVADADGDGIPEVYAADLEGKLYGWSARGQRVFTEESNPAYSGKPLAPFENVRYEPGQSEYRRTQHGFIGSPVIADLDGDGDQDVVAAAMDRHVYAWDAEDTAPQAPGGAAALDGYPTVVVDRSKVASIDPQTHALTFAADSGALMQGAIVDTPALADISGDARPEVVVGTNEEYDEPINAGNFTTASFPLLEATGELSPGNSRVYAMRPEGDTDGDPDTGDGVLAGWPVAAGIVDTELLPVVGEGITGYPVVAPVACPSGGSGPKVGVFSNNGPAYVLNADGTSCYGNDPSSGKPNALEAEVAAGGEQYDTPIIPAVGHPAFGDLGGASPSFLAPAAGARRALDVVLPDYQAGQDVAAAWDSTSGQAQPGFPTPVNDLQFLTGPSIADIDGVPGQEVLEGTASMDLAAFDSAGAPANARWPKLSSDWTVASPLVGSFGTLDTDAAARKVVIGLTRSGYINAYATDAPACSPSSWPRFHHDNANSGDYRRDAALPGKPADLAVAGDQITFTAPGDDLLCDRADHYEVVTSNRRINESSFEQAEPLAGVPAPGEPGATDSYTVPAGAKRYVAVRAVDEQGNVGRVASVDFGGPPPTGDCANPVEGTPAGEFLRGTPRGDRVSALGGDDRVSALGGQDCVNGGGGRDRLRAGRGDDRVKADDGNRDRILCGAGLDEVVADPLDDVADSCEQVGR